MSQIAFAPPSSLVFIKLLINTVWAKLKFTQIWDQQICVLSIVSLDAAAGGSINQYDVSNRIPSADCIDSQYINVDSISKKLIKPRVIGAYHDDLDYKNVALLQCYLSELGHILPRTKTKLKIRQHRKLTKEIKKARQLGLLPFSLYNC
ncbi:30S ribosomal protein S18 [Candidatus Hodgkinia cicadicola]|nr:30S ribosomal protein S18 [Candidatus Hodgkinia cicadicola]